MYDLGNKIEYEKSYSRNVAVSSVGVPKRPRRHTELLGRMVEHASIDPFYEVGGLFLVGPIDRIIPIRRVQGERRRVTVSIPTPDELVRYTDWDTYVTYHAHPMDGNMNFSPADHDYWQEELRQLEDYLAGIRNTYSTDIAAYNYLVRADGEHRILSCGLSVLDLTKIPNFNSIKNDHKNISFPLSISNKLTHTIRING
jgi:hypothetical protein